MKLTETDEIVASTRVFSRTISLGSGNDEVYGVGAGGIGEVCTALDHRKKGLAKQLLLNAIDAMTASPEMKCSLLHASPALTSVYERSADYQAVDSLWSVIPIDLDGIEKCSSSSFSVGILPKRFNVRLASFPNDSVALQKLHQNYSEKRFAGCIIRSIEYWNEYLANEIGDSLYVLEMANDGDANENEVGAIVNEKKVVAWISIRQRTDVRYQLREFGCDRSSVQTLQALPMLLNGVFFQGKHFDDDRKVGKQKPLELHIPTEVLKEMQEEGLSENDDWLQWSRNIIEENDIGWMYRSVGEMVNVKDIIESTKVPHLIWPSDSF